MARQLSTGGGEGFKNCATVDYKGDGAKPGFITGKFIGAKFNVGAYKQTIYSLEVIDGDLATVIKVDKGFDPVDVNPGDTVEIWGCKTLNALIVDQDGTVKVNPGETVKLVYEGKKPSKKKGGKAYYLWTGEVL